MGLVARYLNVDPAKLQGQRGVQSVKSWVANLCEYQSLTIDPGCPGHGGGLSG